MSRNLEEIHKNAKNSFENHEMSVEPDGTYFVGNRDGSGSFAFWVRLHPDTGSAFLWGDLGTMHIRMGHRTRNGIIGWVRSAVSSPSYFFEKVQTLRIFADPCKVYSAHEAEECIKYWEEDDPDYMTPDKAEVMREAIRQADDYQGDVSLFKVHEAWNETFDDFEGLTATDWNPQACWQMGCFSLWAEFAAVLHKKEEEKPSWLTMIWRKVRRAS